MGIAEKAKRISEMKHERSVTVLTAYDYASARLLDECGVDMLLVGDSLGMVVHGFPDTTHVTLEMMLLHVAAVARAKTSALVLGDMPIRTYDTVEQAVETARRLVAAGAEAVKLEGGVGQEEKIRAIVDLGIPVVGHLGMLPQSVLEEGGYKKKGKTEEQAERLMADLAAVERAGVCAVVLESVVAGVAERMTRESNVPTIGIGCGGAVCDGEVAVITDLIGSYPWFVPPFARPEADVAQVIRQAVVRYCERVIRDGVRGGRA